MYFKVKQNAWFGLYNKHNNIHVTTVKIVKKYVYIPRSFLVIDVCNQGNTLCSPCISSRNLGRDTGYPDRRFPFFPQSLQEDAGLIPQLGNGRFLSDPSTSFFTIAQSSDCTVWWQSLAPLSTLNQTHWFTGKCLQQSCFYLDILQFRTNFIRTYSDLSASL